MWAPRHLLAKITRLVDHDLVGVNLSLVDDLEAILGNSTSKNTRVFNELVEIVLVVLFKRCL